MCVCASVIIFQVGMTPQVGLSNSPFVLGNDFAPWSNRTDVLSKSCPFYGRVKMDRWRGRRGVFLRETKTEAGVSRSVRMQTGHLAQFCFCCSA